LIPKNRWRPGFSEIPCKLRLYRAESGLEVRTDETGEKSTGWGCHPRAIRMVIKIKGLRKKQFVRL
jgi:hypothetical protein